MVAMTAETAVGAGISRLDIRSKGVYSRRLGSIYNKCGKQKDRMTRVQIHINFGGENRLGNLLLMS